MRRDIIGAIEAAYRIELAPAEWLRGVGGEVYEQLGGAAGMYGCEYRIIDGTRMSVGEELRLDMPDASQLPIREMLETIPIEFVRKTFARTDCATQSQYIDAELKPFVDASMAPLERFGWRDIMCFSGVDPAGHGVYMGLWLPKPARLAAPARVRWTRVAVHAATAVRLRRRLSDAGRTPEAILTPTGKLEHAEGEAKLESARASLRSAVATIERARSTLRRSDPDAAVASWKGLVATRWSLVDQFESDGKRFVVAQRNEVKLHGLAALSERERQAVAQAALGHTNKIIAYALGVSASTVSVLLHRAARKLGTNTRQELIEAYRRHSHREL